MKTQNEIPLMKFVSGSSFRNFLTEGWSIALLKQMIRTINAQVLGMQNT
jgi:hypothetical protein